MSHEMQWQWNNSWTVCHPTVAGSNPAHCYISAISEEGTC